MSEKKPQESKKSFSDSNESEEKEGASLAPPKFSLFASSLDQNVPSKSEEDPKRHYVVQSGDGLESIATKFGISVADLLNANGFAKSEDAEDYAKGIFIVLASGKKKMLDPGDVLQIPETNSGRKTTSSAGKLAEALVHGGAVSSLAMKGNPIPAGLPPGYPPPKMNISRHVVAKSSFGMAKSSGNSMLLNSISEAELAALYREAAWSGVADGKVTLRNGQTWWINQKTGKFFPVQGSGIIQLSSVEVNILSSFRKAAINGGPDVAINALKKQIAGRGMKVSSSMQKALEILASKYKIPANQLVKSIAGSLAPEAATPKLLIEEAKIVSKGKAFKVIKWGGKLLLVVAVAYDVYELYQADFEIKQVVKTAGGWAGSVGVGTAAAEIASPLLGTGPWGWLGYGVIVVGAGAVGYFIGSKGAETIYEYGWEKE